MLKIIRCETCEALFKVEGPAEAGNEAPILVSCPFCAHQNATDWPLEAPHSIVPDDETDAVA
jgi:phage FluMu protein Com